MAAAAWLVENVTGGSGGTASREHGSGCMASREHGCGVAWLTGWVDPSCTSSRSAFFGDRRACVLAARTHIGQRTWGGVGVGRAESARETGGALWSPGTMSELGAPELHGGDGRIAYPILALYTPPACATQCRLDAVSHRRRLGCILDRTVGHPRVRLKTSTVGCCTRGTVSRVRRTIEESI